MTATLEHVNFTVTDPAATVAMLGRVFGWRIRWQGAAKGGGQTIHLGEDATYLALYRAPQAPQPAPRESYTTCGGLNHIGVVVDDLDAAEARVRAEGLVPHSHADYEPGRRFYFHDGDGIEYEVVAYA